MRRGWHAAVPARTKLCYRQAAIEITLQSNVLKSMIRSDFYPNFFLKLTHSSHVLICLSIFSLITLFSAKNRFNSKRGVHGI